VVGIPPSIAGKRESFVTEADTKDKYSMLKFSNDEQHNGILLLAIQLESIRLQKVNLEE